MAFTRKCQECGHHQAAKEPQGEPTDRYRNATCRKCGSSALDYGSDGYVLVDGVYTQVPLNPDC